MARTASVSRPVTLSEMDARMVTLESEHSMITAAGSAATSGVRVFTATSSQGLLYGMEMVYTVAGWRAPFVMINVSRGLSSPITLEFTGLQQRGHPRVPPSTD